MAGKVHDDFFKSGAGFRYLSLRNQFGNGILRKFIQLLIQIIILNYVKGHHPETVDGHNRYMADQPRVMISYNNMNGYRRNIPKLRTEPPSTFSVDPRLYEGVRKTYKDSFSEAEILEHFKNTYMIGYPFHDNNYNHFHPSKFILLFIFILNKPIERKVFFPKFLAIKFLYIKALSRIISFYLKYYLL